MLQFLGDLSSRFARSLSLEVFSKFGHLKREVLKLLAISKVGCQDLIKLFSLLFMRVYFFVFLQILQEDLHALLGRHARGLVLPFVSLHDRGGQEYQVLLFCGSGLRGLLENPGDLLMAEICFNLSFVVGNLFL